MSIKKRLVRVGAVLAVAVVGVVLVGCDGGDNGTKPTATYTLTTAAEPRAGGSVTRSLNQSSYDAGTDVVLTAKANEGYTFTGWDGAMSSMEKSITVTMNSNLTLTANFQQQGTGGEDDPPTTTFTLTVNPSSAVGGTVTPSMPQSNIFAGTSVGISATASSGYTFVNWTVTVGTATIASPTSATTTVTLSTDATVTANFQQKQVSGTYTGGSKKIGGLTWMTENLNVETPDSWCYGDDPANCAKYGRLYTWEAAKSACESVGWKLPTREDWSDLMQAVGGSSVAGEKLKSTGGWNYNGNGTDDYGFSALPGGYRNFGGGSAEGAGDFGLWWSATESDGGEAYYRNMYYVYDYVDEYTDTKSYGFSARCVEGNAVTPPTTTFTLTVNPSSAVGGTVTPSIPQSNIFAGTSVGISATASNGYTFVNWTVTVGTATIASPTSATTTVTLSTDATVTANFQLQEEPTTNGSKKIGGLTWMTENLNVETPDSWCYDDDPANCAIYGRLYTWEAAKSACASLGGGWRLPTHEDWDDLVTYAGGASTAGRKLKATSGWNDYQGKSGNGTDDYGFSALPGGNRYYDDGDFGNVGNHGVWWSATENVAGGYPYNWYMDYSNDNVGWSAYYKTQWYSVRCVIQN